MNALDQELLLLGDFFTFQDPEVEKGGLLCGDIRDVEFIRDPLSPLLALEGIDGELRLTETVEEKARRGPPVVEERNDASEITETVEPEVESTQEARQVVETAAITHQGTHHAKALPRVPTEIAVSAESKRLSAPREIQVPKVVVPKETVVQREIREWAENSDKRQVKAVYRDFGVNPREVIRLEGDASIPEPDATDHVLLKVEASTVSINDCLLRRAVSFDMLAHPVTLPAVPGHDVVGYIVKAGPMANDFENDFKYGDRVAALVRTGGNARYVSVPVQSLVRVPRSCDSVEAACMVSNYTAAYQSLKAIAGDKVNFSLQGKRVLVVGGMDPVGQALIQLCIKANADRVYATGPEHRHGYIRTVLGADPLPERSDSWLVLIEGDMDVVFDGEYEHGLSASRQALTKKGKLVCFGKRSMVQETELGIFGAPLRAHYDKWQMDTATNTHMVDIWESFQKDPFTYKRNLEALFQLLKWKKIVPPVARRIALSEVGDAQQRVEQGEYRGAVVCLPWKKSSPGRFFLGGDEKFE